MGIRYARQYLDKLARQGKFPKKIHVGEHCVAWDAEEIDQWQQSKMEARDAGVEAEA